MGFNLEQSGGGGGGTTLTGTGIARNTGACTELSGDVTTSGSNAASVVKVNGAAVPVSKTVVGSNSSGQIIDASAFAVGVSSVASQDCYLLPVDTAGMMLAAATTVALSVNGVRAFQFNLNRQVTFTRMSVFVAVTSNGSHYAVGIYSADRNTKLAEGAYTLTASTGIMTATITAVTLNPGTYWLAIGSDSATPTLAAVPMNSSNCFTLYNGGSIVRAGNAANAFSSPHLPSSLGAISSSANTMTAVVLLEP